MGKGKTLIFFLKAENFSTPLGQAKKPYVLSHAFLKKSLPEDVLFFIDSRESKEGGEREREIDR